jgi:hypothetical protein
MNSRAIRIRRKGEAKRRIRKEKSLSKNGLMIVVYKIQKVICKNTDFLENKLAEIQSGGCVVD